MLTVAVPKRNKLQNIIVLTPKDGNSQRRVSAEEKEKDNSNNAKLFREC